MFKNLVLIALLILGGLAAYIAMQPSEFVISRTRTLAAPPALVYAHIADFRKWVAWSPWEKLDPNLRREYSGAPSGPGAEYHWVGNEETGEGRMTILQSHEPDSVSIQLEFVRPFQATNMVQFDILAGGLGTDVTWSMSGHNGFGAKAFALVSDVDKLVGKDFEAGLASLDAITANEMAAQAPPPAELPDAGGESPDAAAPPAAEAAEVEVPPVTP
jgi:hypothetical protein